MKLITAAVVATLLLTATPASAAVVPVDPGPIANGRPIVGTTQNLPSLDSAQPYDAGPGFAAQIRAIYNSGRIKNLQQQVAEKAGRTISSWVREHCRSLNGDQRTCRPMVVFDVDDTMLSGFNEYSGNNPAFSYDPVRNAQFVEDCATPANVPVRRLFSRLVDDGLTIAVITGRPATQRADTIACLNQRGYTGWDFLITRTAKTADLSSSRFKARARKGLQERGFTIVASVGDQVSDMAYGRLKYGFLLPNPMYFLP